MEPTDLIEALAAHVNSEEGAGRFYRQASYWADKEGWDGTESFFQKEAIEEYQHAEKFAKYVAKRGGMVLLAWQKDLGIADLPTSLLDCYQRALTLEQRVMNELDELSGQAIAEGDADSVRFLQEFLKIGTDSIYDLTTWVAQLQRLQNDPAGLYAFDQERE